MACIWDNDYDYLIQRQTKDKHLIIGGRDSAHPAGLQGPLGDSDDSTGNEGMYQRLCQFPGKNFEGWEDGGEVEGSQCWTGIMGFSKDGLPFLGEVPGKMGQFVAAGYNGHGRFQEGARGFNVWWLSIC